MGGRKRAGRAWLVGHILILYVFVGVDVSYVVFFMYMSMPMYMYVSMYLHVYLKHDTGSYSAYMSGDLEFED